MPSIHKAASSRPSLPTYRVLGHSRLYETFSPKPKLIKTKQNRASKVVQQVKTLSTRPDDPDFNSWDPNGGRRKPTLACVCVFVYVFVLACVPACLRTLEMARPVKEPDVTHEFAPQNSHKGRRKEPTGLHPCRAR